MRLYLVVILLVLTCLHTCTNANSAKGPKECCFEFFQKPIPHAQVVSYEETRVDCPKKGVIFTTKRAARICVDPGFRWVTRAINIIDKRSIEGSG